MMRRIDLLPSTYLERRRQRQTVLVIALIGGFLLLLMVVWFVLLGFRVNDANEELATVESQNRQLEAEIAELQRFADLDAEVREKKAALATVMAGDVDWPAILTEIAMVIPGEVWLTNLSASAGATEGATQVGTETATVRISDETAFGRIQFEGRSLSMPGVANWLVRQSTVKEFEAIWLSDATEADTEGVPVFDFTSTLELNSRAASGRFVDGLEGDSP